MLERDQAVELGETVVELHEVVAEGVDGVGVGGLRLHAAGRIPAQTMVEDADVVLVVDLPVDLGCVEHFVAGARYGAEIGKEIGQLRGDRPTLRLRKFGICRGDAANSQVC